MKYYSIVNVDTGGLGVADGRLLIFLYMEDAVRWKLYNVLPEFQDNYRIERITEIRGRKI